MNNQKGTPKEVLRIVKSTPHMVGDGFEIRRPIPGAGIQAIDPFLVLDHAGPTAVPPSDRPKGVDEHPHKGFETVTVLFQGEIAHRDSAGNSGILNAGDVQWMTAASGLVHEEKHGEEFTRNGGTLELIQLWVNLPARFKSEQPGYQDIRNEDIPVVLLPDGRVRVIAGEFNGTKGAARTFTPVDLLDIYLDKGSQLILPRPEGHTTGLYSLQGSVQIDETERLNEGELAGFSIDGDSITLTALDDIHLLMIGGEPLDEPVAAYGPFVMNTMDEVRQAYEDYRTGKLGTLDIPILNRDR